MSTELPVVKLTILDSNPGWEEIVKSYLKEERETLKSSLGVDFEIQFKATGSIFFGGIREEEPNRDLFLFGVENSDDLRWAESYCGIFKDMSALSKLIFITGLVASPYLVNLAAKTGYKQLMTKPALNREFRKMFETLCQIYRINMHIE